MSLLVLQCPLSILQNGPVPDFIPEDVLSTLFALSNNTESNQPIIYLCKGFDRLGLLSLFQRFPIIKHIFHPSPAGALTRKKLLHILEPQFSEYGNNKRKREEEIYTFFNKYVREAASGRFNNICLENILQFVTCCDNEPLLGFTLKPTISFPEAESDSIWHFAPTAHTCSHSLELPIRKQDGQLPEEEELIEIYSTAFLNAFFRKNMNYLYFFCFLVLLH